MERCPYRFVKLPFIISFRNFRIVCGTGICYTFPRAGQRKVKMAEEAKPEKKKVYVETTVISDATALPTNDLSVA